MSKFSFIAVICLYTQYSIGSKSREYVDLTDENLYKEKTCIYNSETANSNKRNNKCSSQPLCNLPDKRGEAKEYMQDVNPLYRAHSCTYVYDDEYIIKPLSKKKELNSSSFLHNIHETDSFTTMNRNDYTRNMCLYSNEFDESECGKEAVELMGQIDEKWFNDDILDHDVLNEHFY